MPTDAKNLAAVIILPSHRGKPCRAAPHNLRHNSQRLHIIHQRGTSIESHLGWIGRLETRLPFAPFKTLQQRTLFAANICTRAIMNEKINGKSRLCRIVSQQTIFISFPDGFFNNRPLVSKLPSDIDISHPRPNGSTGNHRSLQQSVRFIAQNIAIFACARLALIGIDHHITRRVLR